MIDLHSHILPGIDDGPETLEQSLALAKEAVSNGVEVMVATPHHQNGVYMNHKEAVVQAVEYLQQKLDEEAIPLKISPGQEVRVYGDLVKDLENDNLLSIDMNNKYLLLELPYDHVPKFVDQLIYEIQLKGIIPVIPHPERNIAIRKEPLFLYQMIKKGALVQITAASLIGKFGKEVQSFTHQCLEHNLCHLIASDAHKAGKRGVHLAEAYDELENKHGYTTMDSFKNNAIQVFNGQDIYVEQPGKIETKRSWLGLFNRSAR